MADGRLPQRPHTEDVPRHLGIVMTRLLFSVRVAPPCLSLSVKHCSANTSNGPS